MAFSGTLRTTVPTAATFVHELKLDGFRAIVRAKCRLWSRNQKERQHAAGVARAVADLTNDTIIKILATVPPRRGGDRRSLVRRW